MRRQDLFATLLAFAANGFVPSTAQNITDTTMALSSLPASTSADGPASTTMSGTGKIHTVTVGDGAFRYVPNVTYADPGDVVVFEFFPLNHSVVRGEYTDSMACGGESCNPCVPYELIHQGAQGFFSGLREVTSLGGRLPTWNLTINDTEPVWYFCNAPGSCYPNGMAGVINPAENQSFPRQEIAALNAQFQVSPGEGWPAEGVPTGALPTVATTATSTPTGVYPGATVTAVAQASSSSLSIGAIIGIVIGGVAVALLAALLFFYLGRNCMRPARGPDNSRASAATASDTGFTQWLATQQQGGPGPGGGLGGGLGGGAAYGALAQHEKPASPDPARAPDPNARFSYQTVTTAPTLSPPPHQGSFVGYNRVTGIPEYATEVPAPELEHDHARDHGSPSPGLEAGFAGLRSPERASLMAQAQHGPAELPGATGRDW